MINMGQGSSQKIRKAFILCAGLGTRMRPLTDVWPKPLVPFFHEPLVCSMLRQIKDAGITEVMINTHHLAHRWQEYFPTDEWEGVHLTFSYEEDVLETGGGLKKVQDWIGDESLLVCNGDILTNLNFKKLMQEHENHPESWATLALRHEGTNCNVYLNEKTGLIEDMRHKFGVHSGNAQFTGVYCISPKAVEYLPEKVKVSVAESFFKAISLKKLKGIMLNEGYWYELGTPNEYIKAHFAFKPESIHPEAIISKNDSLDHCVVGAKAVIEDRCQLKNCIVLPEVIVPSGSIAENKIFYQ